MCEIAILDPEDYTKAEQYRVTESIFATMGDGLGLTYVKDNGGRLNYEVYKSISPKEMDVADFIDTHEAESELVVIHGRLATHGEIRDEHTHPLSIECDCCDVDYVAHNGVLRGHRRIRERLDDEGHDFTTEVDSEVLAHQYEEVPTDFEDYTYQQGQPAYVLMSRDSMFVYSGRGYILDEYGRMGRSHREFAPSTDTNYAQLILESSDAQ